MMKTELEYSSEDFDALLNAKLVVFRRNLFVLFIFRSLKKRPLPIFQLFDDDCAHFRGHSVAQVD